MHNKNIITLLNHLRFRSRCKCLTKNRRLCIYDFNYIKYSFTVKPSSTIKYLGRFGVEACCCTPADLVMNIKQEIISRSVVTYAIASRVFPALRHWFSLPNKGLISSKRKIHAAAEEKLITTKNKIDVYSTGCTLVHRVCTVIIHFTKTHSSAIRLFTLCLSLESMLVCLHAI